MIWQNLHTHCLYCDGKDTIEELADKAYELGFHSIGFSSHSYMYFSSSKSLTIKDTPKYLNDISLMKNKYQGRMEIYAGIEWDLNCDIDLSPFDYVIGSYHYFHINDQYIGFDRNAETVKNVIDDYFAGDGLAYAKQYYENLASLPEKHPVDIIGHLDLISKHQEQHPFFDEENKCYKNYVLTAIESLVTKIPLLEINTGAMARGFRTTPYPSAFILKEWKKRGGNITISSDCHDKNKLSAGFDKALQLAQLCGYRELYYYNGHSFESTTF